MKKLLALMSLVLAFGLSACVEEDVAPIEEETPVITLTDKESETTPPPTYPVYPPMPVG